MRREDAREFTRADEGEGKRKARRARRAPEGTRRLAVALDHAGIPLRYSHAPEYDNAIHAEEVSGPRTAIDRGAQRSLSCFLLVRSQAPGSGACGASRPVARYALPVLTCTFTQPLHNPSESLNRTPPTIRRAIYCRLHSDMLRIQRTDYISIPY